MSKLQQLIWIASLSGILVTIPAIAEEVKSSNIQEKTDNLNPASKVKRLLAQSPIVIPQVRLQSTDKGLDVILETNQSDKLQAVVRSEGNNYIVDISNTQLRLPNGDTFRQEKPTVGITEVIGKKEVGQQVMADYYRRLAEFKQKMGNNLSKIKVSVVRVYPNNINLYLLDSFCGTVLQDAGLSRPESQNFTASAAKKLFNNPIQMSMGNELIEQADGDVIFIWTAENDAKGNQTAQYKLEQLKLSPLWRNLKAVKENKVYFVPSYWIGSGMLAANAIIDDLFKYLINTP